VTLIVSELIDDWNPLGSAVVQVTVSFVALIRQSAHAAVGVAIPARPANAVPTIKSCLVEEWPTMRFPQLNATFVLPERTPAYAKRCRKCS
jgi:hypothetical protein